MLIDLSKPIETSKNGLVFYGYSHKTAHLCKGIDIPWNAGGFVMKDKKVIFIGTFWAAQGVMYGNHPDINP